MRHRLFVLLVVSSALVACSASRPVERSAWDPEAMGEIEDLAAKLRAGGVPCKKLEFANFVLHAADYAGRFPLPAALASCESVDAEDITFSVFDSANIAEEFLAAKHARICRTTNHMKSKQVPEFPVFPGFPHVVSGHWVVEPDLPETTEKVARILGSEAKRIPCVYVPPEKAPEPGKQ